MKNFSIIVAFDDEQGIGKLGALAWHLPADLKHFKEITTMCNDPMKKNAVIMGRKTWESLPDKFRPLPNRLNIVLTQQKFFLIDLASILASNLDHALNLLSLRNEIENVFVIGGAQLYSQAILHPLCQKIFATTVKGKFNCDVFFPPIPLVFNREEISPVLQDGFISHQFLVYKKS